MKRITKITETKEYAINFTGVTATVKEYHECVNRLGMIEDIIGEEYDLDRLRELVEADRNGRCVVLPCYLGQDLYLVNKEIGLVLPVCAVLYQKTRNAEIIIDDIGFSINVEEIGKPHF